MSTGKSWTIPFGVHTLRSNQSLSVGRRAGVARKMNKKNENKLEASKEPNPKPKHTTQDTEETNHDECTALQEPDDNQTQKRKNDKLKIQGEI